MRIARFPYCNIRLGHSPRKKYNFSRRLKTPNRPIKYYVITLNNSLIIKNYCLQGQFSKQGMKLTPATAEQFIVCLEKNSFLCSICHKSFKRHSNTLQHIRTVHLKIDKHPCSYCGSVFTQTSSRNLHEKRCKAKPPL